MKFRQYQIPDKVMITGSVGVTHNWWEAWLSNPWFCWGFGSYLALNVGYYTTALLLEYALAHGQERSMISYGVFSSKSHRRRSSLLVHKEPSFAEQLSGSLWTTAGPAAISNAMLAAFLMPYVIPGPYPTLPNLSWLELVCQILAFLIANDFLLYWGHRIQHESDYLWQFHAEHHRISTPRPLTTANIHPIDGTLQGGLPLILACAWFKPHPLIFYGLIVVRYGENVLNHSGLDTWWTRALKGSWFVPFVRAGVNHHDRHHKMSNHAKGATNYGESLVIWDWLFGTLAKTDLRYREDDRLVNITNSLKR